MSPSGHHPLQTTITIDPGHLLLTLHLLLLSLLTCLLLAQQCLHMPSAPCKQRLAAPPVIPPAPTRSQHECRVSHQPSNVYGDDRHLAEQVKEIEHKSRWWDIIRERGSSHQPEPQMPGNLPSTPVAPPAHTPTPSTTSDSENDIEQLCYEGGAKLAAFLMSKAIVGN